MCAFDKPHKSARALNLDVGGPHVVGVPSCSIARSIAEHKGGVFFAEFGWRAGIISPVFVKSIWFRLYNVEISVMRFISKKDLLWLTIVPESPKFQITSLWKFNSCVSHGFCTATTRVTAHTQLSAVAVLQRWWNWTVFVHRFPFMISRFDHIKFLLVELFIRGIQLHELRALMKHYVSIKLKVHFTLLFWNLIRKSGTTDRDSLKSAACSKLTIRLTFYINAVYEVLRFT